ncbi:DNA sulfur modification protein DndB [Vibrio neptunius]|uniref:DNA sulfur modification protein DndB n=1 Tax=Vibrio neptunius TaxID=170651 RepID=A0ABS2ZY20_9VIBR|nr:DNA sulfur modification protein DndB [Vibrio neptunius]MBN3492227.1 DNA sulfur modification protein DndB [Vibrio neptunius]MBN3514724.1 DNA sulfur modification protein DndB [Vibrio neptunius]MBN3552121.1 DNA sulfur modification protein DndB [Vibrio neptunius]MBN3576675.1 DNA sulfur modification protein DndB [Vibrio neptunius]MCH9870339.1 DNA sulfur modification protein DndB [Vibrio neptunius]
MNRIISGISFPAIRGIQAEKEFYTVMCPLKRLKRIFTFDETSLLPEDRAQRSLNPNRIPHISNYILSNRSDYTFSSLTACIAGECNFISIEDSGPGQNIGTLLVDEEAEFYITDGQHRTAAIKDALDKDPSLEEEHISVVFYVGKNLSERQKIFRDLNLFPVKTGKSYGVLFGNSPEEKLTNQIVKLCEFFNGVISFEDGNLGPRSSKLFKHSSLHAANLELFPDVNEENFEDCLNQAVSFWDSVSENINIWKLAKNNDITPKDRKEYIVFSAIVLKCLGIVGNQLIMKKNHKQTLRKLRKVDWRRSNRANWEGRCISQGRMIHNNSAALLTVATIKSQLDLPLTPKEQAEEAKFQEARKND